MTRSRQQTQFFAALDRLRAPDRSQLVEGAGTVRLDGVFGNEQLRGDLPIAEAARDQVQDFQFPRRNAKGLLPRRVGRKRLEGGRIRRNQHFLHHDRFADSFATPRDPQAEPDAEGRKKNSYQRAVDLDGMLDNNESVFSVLERRNQEAADETEDEDMPPH